MTSVGDPERYLTVEELREELGRSPRTVGLDPEDPDDVAEYEDLLERLLDEESERLEGPDFAGTTFVERGVEETLFSAEAVRGSGRDLVPSSRPIASLESVEPLDADVSIDVADVRVRETHLELLEDADVVEWPTGAIEVEYTAGFDSVPGPIVDGLVRLVRSRIDRRSSDGVESESVPSGQSVQYRPASDVRRDVRSTASKYRPDSYGGSGAMVI